MKGNFLYLSIDLLTVAFPLIFSFHPRNNFYKKWIFVWPAILLTAAIFVVWDNAFTAMGVWGFNRYWLTGIHLFHLPVEEILFFICVPYSCLFLYDTIEIVQWNWIRPKIQFVVSISLGVALLLAGIYFHDRWYTSATFTSLAVVLLVLQLIVKPVWLGHFYSAWLLILIPFFIINGVLTGSVIDSPVVWYNDAENLGIRIGTIPVEDAFYGMLLILINVCIYEQIRKR